MKHRIVGLFAVLAALSMTMANAEIEEIVVTATKRAVSEQDTPLSMEAFLGEDIQAQNIGDLEDLAMRIPNLNISNGDQVTRVSIRGLGTGNERSFEQSVAMFIDGVYMPRSRQYRAPFFDMDRVEVLRGPQASLYGLNATAGTILIHTNTTQPGDEAHFSVGGGFETEYDGYYAEVVAGGSIGDSLGLRLAARFNDTGDGYFENVITGDDENSTEETLVRLTADWAVSDTWNITAKAFYADADEFGNYGENVQNADTQFSPAVATGLGLNPDTRYDYRRQTDNVLTDFVGEDPGLEHELLNFSVASEWMIGENTLNVLVSYSESDYLQAYNVDALSSLPGNASGLGPILGQVLGSTIDESFEQTALEIRFASPADRDFSYIVGLYVDSNELTNVLDAVAGPLLGGTAGGGLGIAALQQQRAEADTISPYVSGTWNITPRFNLTAGVRYSNQEKDYERASISCSNLLNDAVVPAAAFGATPGPGGWYAFADLTGSGINLCGTLDGLELDRESDNWMPELIAQFDVTEDSVAYAKIGRSAKSGGFNFSSTLPTVEDAEFDDEEAIGIEVGLKSRLLDQRLELNVAYFHNEFDDLQVSSFVTPPGSAPILVVSNAGESTSEGVEAEVNFAATDWLTVGTSLGWLDSSYDKYEAGPCNIGEQRATPGIALCDKTGQDTNYAPEFSGSVYADFELPISGNLLLTGGVLMAFSDSFFTDAANNASGEQDSYETWDARIGIANSEGKWSVSLVGRNLSDERVLGYTLPFAGQIGYLQAPRTVLLQGRVSL